MAHRRSISTLIRRASALISSKSSLSTLKSPLVPVASSLNPLFEKPQHISPSQICSRFDLRQFLSDTPKGSDDDEDDGDDEDDEDDTDVENQVDSDDEVYTGSKLRKEYTAEEKEAEAAAIGYKVIGPLERSDRVFNLYEPVFAVVQIGSHQFKVSNGDCIFSERLKFCEVNDKLILNKVLLVGSSSQTIVGRPVVPDAAVHAVVEEHALDAKVIIFKKKRRKNYRRTKGHRQELTKLRITDIQGIEKPETTNADKPVKTAVKKSEKVAVAA